MQTGSMRVKHHAAARLFSRVLLLSIALCLAQAAVAQQTAPLSPSVVLVLKLVSSTHVKPTTGIVVSDNGLVLVPADFAAGEGEMIVLDGGTDIVSNGRPAKLTDRITPDGLALLSVEGLGRPAISLSGNALGTDNRLHLEAFPPAEQIAKGVPPLWLPLEVLRNEADMQVSISTGTPLPPVSGAVIDACGYLAGVNLSNAPQSQDSSGAALMIFAGELRRILDSMQLNLPVANCVLPVPAVEALGVVAEQKEATVNSKLPSETSTLTTVEEHSEPATAGLASAESAAEPAGVVVPEIEQQSNTTPAEKTSVWNSIPLWLPLLGIVILAVFIWKGLFFYRLGKIAPENASAGKRVSNVQPASDEPVTAPLASPAETNPVKPRSVPVFDNQFPQPGERPEGCDGLIVIEGLLDPETGFKRFCFVDTQQVNIIIGRGDADIAIEHAAISRAHARVEYDGEMLSLSDLGSSNGSFIGDVPCLPGEVLYFREEDEIFLGDVKLTVRVVRQEAEWA